MGIIMMITTTHKISALCLLAVVTNGSNAMQGGSSGPPGNAAGGFEGGRCWNTGMFVPGAGGYCSDGIDAHDHKTPADCATTDTDCFWVTNPPVARRSSSY